MVFINFLMKKFSYCLLYLFVSILCKLNAQTSNISGVINSYASVTSIGTQSINTVSSSGFAIGDKVLLIQMKGASIDTSNTALFGTINSYNDAGNYEMLIISAISSTTITFTNPINRTYMSSGLVQLVKVPVYNNVIVTGVLTCLPWNGSVGGVLAFETSGNVTLNANIDVTSKGFLGGGNVFGQFISCSGNTTDYKLPTSSLASAFKGEGITKIHSTYSKGLGALGNGGGAGNDVNGGGAGGGNYGLGGHGGNSMCSSNPISLCGGSNGKSCVYSNSSNKIFLGGGGGAGHQNDGFGTGGVSGGGIILIRCVTLIGNNNSIISNGADNTAIAGNDGQGGGGAGGTILIDACSTSSLTISAKGGFGGIDNYVGASCHGKGGGGGGGLIWTSNPLTYNSILTGGVPGIFTSPSSPCFNTSNGATAGQVGGTLSGLVIPGSSPLSSIDSFTLSTSSNCLGGGNSTAIATLTTTLLSPIVSYTWTNSSGSIVGQTNNTTSLVDSVNNLANGNYTISVMLTTPCSTLTGSQTHTINCFSTSTPICSGTLGVPVFFEDFGSGASLYGPALPPGVTNYTYLQGIPNNGTYVIASSSNPSGTNAGYVNDNHDHTGNANGYMMVVNSDYPAAEVYRKHVTGLCPGTTYVFSAYLANNNSPAAVTNVCGASYIYANIKFQVEFPVGTIQNSITSGNLAVANTATALPWIQYGFAFTTGPGQTSADVVLKNNAPGGCGNDYVVDDISLAPCGPGVSLSIVPNNTVVCPGSAITLQSNFTSGSYTIPQYQWQYSSDGGVTWNDISGATSSNYTISSVNSAQGGMYQLLVSENGNINLSSCRISAGPLTFSVSNGVTLSATSSTVCSGNNITLSATGATSYLWSNNAVTNSIIVNPTTTTSYSVIGTTGTCTSQAVVTVSVVPNATLSITGNSIICSGQSTTLTANGANTYTWSSGATLSNSSGSIAVVNPLSTSNYTVIGTLNSCTNSAIATVSVLSTPTISLNSNGSICLGTNVSTTLTANGANAYSWSNSATLSSSTGSIVTASPNTTTVYTVTGTSASCSNTAAITVNVNASPTITAVTFTNTSCGLNNGAILVTSSPTNNTYTWSAGITSTTNTASSLTSGTYSVTVYNGSCQTTTVVNILSSLPLQITSSTITPSDCNLNNGSITVNDNYVNSNYSWSPNISLTNTAINLPSGNYALTITNGACSTSSVFVISQLSGPTNVTVNQSDAICESINGSINIISVTNGIAPYQYNFNNNGFSSITTYSNLAQGVYTITVKDAHGCLFTQTFTIDKSLTNLTIDLITNSPTCNDNDGSYIINGFTSGTPPYFTSFNNGSYSSNLVFDQLGIGTYSLSIRDSNMCETGYILTMQENGDYTLYIPNTFTPNNNKVNDIWYVKGTCLEEFNCLIFNRWGEKIKELTDIKDGWDGTYKGNPVPDGVYVYIIEAKAKKEVVKKSGHITVFR